MNFTISLETLYENARSAINKAIRESTETSKHSNATVIKINNDDVDINLDGGRYLTEISEDSLIDNDGLEYSYGVLSYEDLMSLADWVSI